MEIKIRYLREDEIEEKAQAFLEKYHPTFSLYIPIEEIIEFALNIDIIPVPGLLKATDKIGLNVDAFYSPKHRSITVDEFVFEKRKHRYRFSLAHEIAHKILHDDVYDVGTFTSVDEYLSFINELPSDVGKRAQWQANEFAGRILMPTRLLKEEFEKAIAETEKETEFSLEKEPKIVAESAIEYFLRDLFRVSSEAIRIRLENEGLIARGLFDDEL